jgi:LEA14-like dessication related protein
MQKKSTAFTVLCFFVIIAFLTGCAAFGKPSESNFKDPVISLDSMEVAHSFGYWYFSSKVKPTKGNPGNVGAPLDIAFTFNIQNPNSYPVMLEDIKYTVAFEEFDLNSVSSTATQWIPAGKTNQVRVHAHFDVRQSLLSLLVTGGFKLKEKGTNAWEQLEAWWTRIPNYEIPINVKDGAAIFKADGIVRVVPFSATFP